MNCREAEHLFDRYLDKDISVADFSRLREHLEICPRCVENWLSLRKAADLLAALPEEDPAPEVFSRIVIMLPKSAKRGRAIPAWIWQTAAAVLIACAIAGISYTSGTRQLSAAVTQSQDGRIIVQPRPGQPLIIPPGATVTGDLRVEGDVYLYGQVHGRTSASGKIRIGPKRGCWERFKEKLRTVWQSLAGE